eukprot:615081-Rhodomonas_salina.1
MRSAAYSCSDPVKSLKKRLMKATSRWRGCCLAVVLALAHPTHPAFYPTWRSQYQKMCRAATEWPFQLIKHLLKIIEAKISWVSFRAALHCSGCN